MTVPLCPPVAKTARHRSRRFRALAHSASFGQQLLNAERPEGPCQHHDGRFVTTNNFALVTLLMSTRLCLKLTSITESGAGCCARDFMYLLHLRRVSDAASNHGTIRYLWTQWLVLAPMTYSGTLPPCRVKLRTVGSSWWAKARPTLGR